MKLLDQVHERTRHLHYSQRTEEAYVHWCRAFIRFHGIRHPAEMGGPEVEAFLSWLSADRRVAVSTHRQALSALLYLYGKALGVALPWMDEIGRPQVKRRLPVVLSRPEVLAVLDHLEGNHRLFAQMIYGTGICIIVDPIYTHVLKVGGSGVRSPMDSLALRSSPPSASATSQAARPS